MGCTHFNNEEKGRKGGGVQERSAEGRRGEWDGRENGMEGRIGVQEAPLN